MASLLEDSLQKQVPMVANLAAMGQYDDVNREIQNFLASQSGKTRPSHEISNCSSAGPEVPSLPEILPVLQQILDTYTKIKCSLDAHDLEGVKETLLKSDLKMSVVSETLLATLQHMTEEKKRIAEENTELASRIRKYAEDEAIARVQRERTESELELKRREVEELTRLLKDYKQRHEEARQDAQKARSDAALARVRLEELENLKARAAERISVHEKETAALSQVIREKDAEIRKLMEEKRAEENKNSGAKMRVVELERLVEVLNKKLEAREKSLSLCNSELSKLIAESKAAKQEFEKNRESCLYYEKLYRSLDRQNAYLNGQLNRLLRSGNYGKEETFKKIEKYRKKARKARKEVKELKEEIERLQEEIRYMKEISAADETETLIRQVDELSQRNKAYEEKLRRLEEEKRVDSESRTMSHKERKLSNEEEREKAAQKEPRPCDKARNENLYRTKVDYDQIYDKLAREKDFYEKFTYGRSSDNQAFYERPKLDAYAQRIMSRGNSHDLGRDVSERERGSAGFGGYHEGIVPVWGRYAPSYDDQEKTKESALFKTYEQQDHEPVLPSRMFNLDHSYDERPTIIPGGFAGLEDQADKGKLDNQILFADEKRDSGKKEEGGKKRLEREGTVIKLLNHIPGVDAKKPVPLFGNTDEELPKFKAVNGESQLLVNEKKIGGPSNREASSAESVKSVHTTSSLKEMMARTDQLQKKFENLEEQLANIKEEDTAERLSEKMKTFSTNYSTWNVDSEDSDII